MSKHEELADPKYANLPGLAPDDEPDTFETDDRPEAEQDVDFEDESDAVEKLYVSAEQAFSKFKDKDLDGNKADFSDRLRKDRNTGYVAHSGEWELAGRGDNETVLQKYQRLQLEVQQLDEQISGLRSSPKDGASQQDRPDPEIGPEVARLQRHLCESNLEQLLGSEVLNLLGDPQGALQSKLQLQLSQLTGSGGTSPPAPAGSAPAGLATYELHVRPDKVRAHQSGALGELEKRLERLEKAVGAAPEKMSRLSAETRQKSLLAAVATLSSKVALLEPATLEAAETRLQALHQRMNQLSEQRQTTVEQDKLSKITELYDIMQKSAAIRGEVPTILERLHSLQTLHDQALNFSRALTHLETAQQKMESDLGQGEMQLNKMLADSAASLAVVQDGLHVLSDRLTAAGN